MIMKTQPVKIAISNQKGGVGKSTFTIILASYFQYIKNKNVLVVDCDFPQYSLKGVREREKQIVNRSSEYKQMFVRQMERTGVFHHGPSLGC